jgi:hypothetical protein
MLRYRYVHLWYAFGVVDKKEYLSVCRVCKQSVSLQKKEIEPKELLAKMNVRQGSGYFGSKYGT